MGLYFANNIPVGSVGLVKHIDLIFRSKDFSGPMIYTLDLIGCAFVDPSLSKCVDFFGTQTNTFKEGRFNGNQLIPVDGPSISIFDRAIDRLFNIEWCPDQNQFMVKVMMSPPYTLVHKPKVSDEL